MFKIRGVPAALLALGMMVIGQITIAGAVDMNVPGGPGQTALGANTHAGTSTIAGDGSGNPGTFTVLGSTSLENTGSVTVQGDGHASGTGTGTLLIDATGRYDNGNSGGGIGNTTINNGGILQNDGTVYNYGGAMTFESGGMLLNNGEINNNSTATPMEFKAGSIYDAASTGYIKNQGNVVIDTGMQGLGDLFNKDGYHADSGTVTFTGGSAALAPNLKLEYTTNDGTYRGTVVIATDSGGVFNDQVILGDQVMLRVDTSNTFNNTVDAYGLTVWSGASTFNNAVTIGDTGVAVRSGATANFTNSASAGTLGFDIAANGTMNFTGANADLTAGDVTNAGKLVFATGSAFSSSGTIMNSNELWLSSGMDNLGYAFGQTTLHDNGFIVITESNGSAANLTLGGITGTGTPKVTIRDGGAFAGVDALTAELIIGGNGAAQRSSFSGTVSAGQITVTSNKANAGATFNGIVSGYLVVNNNGLAILGSGSSFSANNVKVDAGGELRNEFTGFQISSGNTFTNEGTFTNTSAGTITFLGNLTNSGEFINQGRFINDNTNAKTLLNDSNGVMRFVAGSNYQHAGANASWTISNSGKVHAEAGMTGLALLMTDLNMNNGSEFYLNAETNRQISQNLVLGGTVDPTAKAYIQSGAYTITFNNTYGFNAQNAELYVDGGEVILSSGSGLTTTSTTEGFTAINGAHVVAKGAGPGTSASYINAPKAAFKGNSSLDVDANSYFEMRAGAGGSVAFQDTSRLNVANGGTFTMTGSNASASFASGTALVMGSQSVVAMTSTGQTATFANGSRLDMAANSAMRVDGNVNFNAGSTLRITGSGSGISEVHSVNGQINVADRTNLILEGSRADLENKYFLVQENDNTAIAYQNLYNAMYELTGETGPGSYAGGYGVRIASIRSTTEIMANAVGGYDELSINKYNGGEYTDAVFGTAWGQNNTALNTYIQEAGRRGIDPKTAEVAFAQLYGEYGAYAAESLLSATDNFKRLINRQLGTLINSSTLSVCNVCHEAVIDYCDPCGAPAVPYAGGFCDGKGRIWGGAFGDWADQHDRKNIHGYEYSAAGMALGFEYAPNECLTLGIAGAYTDGSIKVNDMNTKFNTNVYHAGAYGRYLHASGLFVQAGAGYGYGRGDYDVGLVLGGKKSAKYDNQAYYGNLEVGYQFALGDVVNVIPSVGVDYMHISQDGWVEKGHGPLAIANRFGRSNHNIVDLPVALRVNKVFDCGNFAVAPELYGAWIYRANDKKTHIESAYNGSELATTMFGVERGPHRGVVGVNVNARFAERFDAAVGYQVEFNGRYRDHNLTGTVGLAF